MKQQRVSVMRLAACVPSIPAVLVSSLEKCGIRTETDLLFSASTFDIFRRLPAGTTTLRELKECTAVVGKLASAPGRSAADLIKALPAAEEEEFLSGVPSLDRLLHGLVSTRRLIEVSGDRGSGKTSLVLHLVLRHLIHRPQSGILWIDTTGDFSAATATDILEKHEELGAPTALDRLQVSLAFEVDAVYDVLQELKSSLTSGVAPEIRVRGIVVDTITALLGPNLSPISSHGHAIMTGFMQQLRAFAQTFSLTIFVINNSAAYTPFVSGTASNNPNIRKPALGPSFTFLTDATLWLALRRDDSDAQGDGYTKHVAQVYRSKVTASKTLCSFRIQQGVVLACGEEHSLCSD
ncbi:P-loop containing nucleoside triphosphate hydrolase protein, partial [Mycena sp. CBHHK59/15]